MPTEPHFSQKSQRVLDLEAQVKELEAWKESALTILNQIDFQAIGKELDLTLGVDVAPNILPAIRELKQRIALLNGDALG